MNKFMLVAVVAAAAVFAAPASVQAQVIAGTYPSYYGAYSPYGYGLGNYGLYGNGIIQTGYNSGLGGYGGYYGGYGLGTGYGGYGSSYYRGGYNSGRGGVSRGMRGGRGRR